MTDLNARFERHSEAWRDPLEVLPQWGQQPDGGTLANAAEGAFWDIVGHLGITLFVTREYEHLVLALTIEHGRPAVSFMSLPHPSGLAFDRDRGVLHVASTRNPNQIYELAPATALLPRLDSAGVDLSARPLVPVRTRFLPGCYYIHDLALIGGALHANSVGQNAVVRIDDGDVEMAWWPLCMDVSGTPHTGRNEIQLNSIAAGATLEESYFSASGTKAEATPPGHPDYPVDGRGVIFSGKTREPFVRGLTRPHSARLHGGTLWADNSGYGTLVAARPDGTSSVVARLPGWTRGLAFAGDVAFVGTSRVIPRFRQYAPGLDTEASVCAVHAVDTRTGKILGSLTFPFGNQVFAIEAVPSEWSGGFPFRHPDRRHDDERQVFYAYDIPKTARLTDEASPTTAAERGRSAQNAVDAFNARERAS
jgi:uncharacterized protein (TIGR03032 family)